MTHYSINFNSSGFSGLQQHNHALQLLNMVVVVWTLADVIIKLRESKGWNRIDLAAKARMSYATITRMETGKNMQAASIAKVAAAFNLTLAELYGLVPSARVVDAQTRERDQLWMTMDDAVRERALNALRGVVAASAPAPSPASHARTVSQTPVIPQKASRTHRTKRGA